MIAVAGREVFIAYPFALRKSGGFMRQVILSALLIVSLAALARGQISTDEAMANLKAKQEAREAERNKPVTITQGELDDLKANIASLEAQVIQLRAAAAAAAAATPKVEAVREISVGETHEQVADFFRRHPTEYEVISDTPVSTSHSDKPEILVVMRKARVLVLAGSHDEYNGVSHRQVADYGEKWAGVEQLTIKLVDNKVASIDRWDTGASNQVVANESGGVDLINSRPQNKRGQRQ
jgi:hypothetical protein